MQNSFAQERQRHRRSKLTLYQLLDRSDCAGSPSLQGVDEFPVRQMALPSARHYH